MAYCTADQVADEFNGIGSFSASTQPTSSTVERWIAEADQVIDAKVGLRYEVPLNSSDHPNAIIIIRNIAIMLVSARVRRRLNRSGPSGETAKTFTQETDSKAMKMLDQIAEGKVSLPELTPKNPKLGIGSFAVDNSEEYTFKKNVDQW